MSNVEQYVGSLVEIDCSVLGVYLGVIEGINVHDQSVEIRNASKNGKKLVFSDVTIAAEDIVNIKFVNKVLGTVPPNEARHSPNGVRSPAKTRLETRQRSRTFSNALSTARAQRDIECFAVETRDPQLLEDFDFEKNLGLFNKTKVFEEIDRAQRGDNPVRLVDCNLKKSSTSAAKYRHDENILDNVDKVISRETERKAALFSVVPSGCDVTAVARSTRDQVMSEAIKLGLSADSQREAMARNVCGIILQQNNRNTVAFLVSPERGSGPISSSLCGLSAARQLSGKVPRIIIMTTRAVTDADVAFNSELQLCKMAGLHVIVANSTSSTPVDIVIGCTLHPFLDQCAKKASTTVLLVDPPFYSPNLANIVLFPILPLLSSIPTEADSKCKMYIGDLGIPVAVYGKCGLNVNREVYHGEGFVARINRKK